MQKTETIYADLVTFSKNLNKVFKNKIQYYGKFEKAPVNQLDVCLNLFVLIVVFIVGFLMSVYEAQISNHNN